MGLTSMDQRWEAHDNQPATQRERGGYNSHKKCKHLVKIKAPQLPFALKLLVG